MGIIVFLFLFVGWIGFNYYLYKCFGRRNPVKQCEKELKEGVDFVYDASGYRIDPKTNDPRYKDLLYKTWLAAEAALEVPWKWPDFVIETPKLQKKILKEKYGINYRTREELNPDVKFSLE